MGQTCRPLSDDAVLTAISNGALSQVSPTTVRQLLANASIAEIDARTPLYTPNAGREQLAYIVVRGLVRFFLVGGGRELTLWYGRPGTIGGATRSIVGPVPAYSETITPCRLVIMDVSTLSELAQQDGTLAWALAQELGRIHRELLRTVADTAFGSVRQRVARHLLDLSIEGHPLAPEGMDSHSLFAQTTHQTLADGPARCARSSRARCATSAARV